MNIYFTVVLIKCGKEKNNKQYDIQINFPAIDRMGMLNVQNFFSDLEKNKEAFSIISSHEIQWP